MKQATQTMQTKPTKYFFIIKVPKI